MRHGLTSALALVLLGMAGCGEDPAPSLDGALKLWPAAADPEFCNFLLDGDIGILYGFRAENVTKSAVTLTGVEFRVMQDVEVLEASLLPVEDGGLTDGYPPSFPSDDAWEARLRIGADARIGAGEEQRLMVAVGLVGDQQAGRADDIVISYTDEAGAHSQFAPVKIEIRTEGSCTIG